MDSNRNDMSKRDLKKLLATMEKDQIVQLVLDLYSAKREAKEYLDFYVDPDEQAKLKEYKDIVREEFFPRMTVYPKFRMANCRRAFSDFRKLKPSPDMLGDLLVYFIEVACLFIYKYRCIFDKYHFLVAHFASTLGFIERNDLWDTFGPRVRKCIESMWLADLYLYGEFTRIYEDVKGEGHGIRLKDIGKEHRDDKEKGKEPSPLHGEGGSGGAGDGTLRGEEGGQGIP